MDLKLVKAHLREEESRLKEKLNRMFSTGENNSIIDNAIDWVEPNTRDPPSGSTVWKKVREVTIEQLNGFLDGGLASIITITMLAWELFELFKDFDWHSLQDIAHALTEVR